MKETVVIEENETSKIELVVGWLVNMAVYAVILVVISLIFPKTVYIDRSMFGLWAIVSAVLISILNQTIKPLIVWFTMPITGLTLGLFYPFINLIILKLVSILTLGHFEIRGIFFAVLVSIIISWLSIFIDKSLRKIIGKER